MVTVISPRSTRKKYVWLALALLLAGLLAYAWSDGGYEEKHLIEKDIPISGTSDNLEGRA
ncbi:hypothetical protein [Croceicoccus mobilis]|uniref:Uncharacterized protein n=1 Tax=Croceicoccus mobilis TaxID=1703339 RepID=A0A916Z6S6_9SPHN|nr:hypothetical protein [Croceicoccus mobilis]GGD78028.1 hypothetical protein GCM10010990_29770 [Croceicoccus mobilis]